MPKRILVVDDDPEIIGFLERSLNYKGFETYSCFDGDQALLHMQDVTPDLIITDLNMPGINGLELAKKTKESSNLPVIIMTGRPELIPQENPANQVLKKPVDFYFLLETVNKLI